MWKNRRKILKKMKTKSKKEKKKVVVQAPKGKRLETLELDKDIFNGKFNESLLYQTLVMYRANQRGGNASTKRRGEVRGGGKKPWRQKGTGRARVGSSRNPIWRGGGIAFGPHPRDFSYNLPKKLKNTAFVSSLNAKIKSGQILAIDEVKSDSLKTKNFADLLKELKVRESVLLLVDKLDKNIVLGTRNIRNLTLRKADEATALDVLSKKYVIITKKAAEALNKRAKR